jgi:hypothetical protein
MITSKARKTFEKALKKVAKIRFHDGWLGCDIVKPKVANICDISGCTAGSLSSCCHRFIRNKIPFCVY